MHNGLILFLMKKEYLDFYKKRINKRYIIFFLIIAVYVALMFNRTELKKNLPQFGIFFLNTMPNLLAGFAFTFIIQDVFNKNRKTKLSIFIKSLLIGLWLTVEEFYPIFSHNNHFDYYDILMSWIGVLIAFAAIINNEKK